jgi:hypothetical protein
MSRFMKVSGGVGEGMGLRLMRAVNSPEYQQAFAKVAHAAAERVRAGGGPSYLRQVGGWSVLLQTSAAWWLKAALSANLGRLRDEAQSLL